MRDNIKIKLDNKIKLRITKAIRNNINESTRNAILRNIDRPAYITNSAIEDRLENNIIQHIKSMGRERP